MHQQRNAGQIHTHTHTYIYYSYYFSPCEFFLPVLTSGLSLKSKWQEVYKDFQDSSKYSNCSLDGLNFFSLIFISSSLLSKSLGTIQGTPAPREGCSCGVIVKAMNHGIIESEFELQPCHYVHFQANTLGKGMIPLILPTMGQIVLLPFF